MSKYSLRQLAKSDLEEIWLYSVEKHGITQAEKYTNQLTDRFQWLAENPMLGVSRNEIKEAYRSWQEGEHAIFYRITGKSIEIIGLVGPGMQIEHHLTP